MQEDDKKKNNSISDSEESYKNDEYSLGLNSKYKIELYKEDEIDDRKNEINRESIEQKQKLSSDSTTISGSLEYNNTQKIRNTLPRDDIFINQKGILEFYDNQRKMSSPLCDYLSGSDKYLSKMLKTPVDIKSSPNFIKKEDFFNGEKKNRNINHINNIENEKNVNINIISQKQNEKINNQNKLSFNNNINMNDINGNLPVNNLNNINNINNFNNNYINNNLYFLNNNYPPQQIFNINYINLNNIPNNNNIINRRKMSYNIENDFIGNYFNNILNPNNLQRQQDPNFINLQNQPQLNPLFFSYNNEPQSSNMGNKNNIKKNSGTTKTVKKPLDKRKGDWQCPKCNNLNFAFRVICNRCQLQKPNNLGGKNE